jgi:DNA mismatch endonuclease, patch repair protein
MTDVHSKEVRSYNMSQIKGKNTKPEMIVRKFLHSQGFRYRLNVKNLPGTPDLVLPRYRTVIFVHGCFWHGHKNCKYSVIPKTRTDWWTHKIDKTKEKDSFNINELKNLGWEVYIIWECKLRNNQRLREFNKVVRKLKPTS